ncbi:serine protease [Eubacterium sp. am_0171]|uniref:serpin family protein n=1 Tax=unclassified Eubacterium (in: firmicutes) TaxID=2624479 RepID=UPI00101FF26F|nr:MULTISPECIES: serpin family protein [unclassified Eubacterium (in: firmicutes)]MSC84895.1 serine protease [Eubacterium sp. BIOML-A1]MSD07183.1 serine protease [Eubacterium sp. BIOML-A2]RYT15877.1 serine protease [Eubacterium sp. am_0171]
MKKRMFSFCIAVVLTGAFLLSGCGKKVQASDLMKGVKANDVSKEAVLRDEDTVAAADFAVRLFEASRQENSEVLISPVSVLYALAMTANGAEGETLTQMEDVLGLSVEELNPYLYAYKEALASGNKYKLDLANSIWFKEDESLTVNPDFLQANADWYDAELYQAPFDNSTLKDINNWVSDKTDGMIEDILDEIPDEAIMYLINAIAFDAEWENIYKENEVMADVFTTENGSEQIAELMYSEENEYLEDENTTGLIKYYKDGKYAFAGLLPKEGISVSEYISSLTGEKLMRLLNNSQSVPVDAAIPKFENEYDTEMSEILKDMGMTNAFDPGMADFSGLGTSTDGNIYINRVLHKTYIAVDEQGTKAGAATAVELMTEAAMIDSAEHKTVYLNRPFIYMLIDSEAKLPVFMGTVMDIKE